MRLQFQNVYCTFHSAVQGSYRQVLEDGNYLIASEDSLPAQPAVKILKLSMQKEPYYLLCSKKHVALQTASDDKPLQLSHFADNALFLHKNLSPDFAARMERYAYKATGVHPEILRLESTDSIMAYLLAGIGYTIVPAWCSKLYSSVYHAVPLENCSSVVLAYRADLRLTGVAKEFLKGLKATAL